MSSLDAVGLARWMAAHEGVITFAEARRLGAGEAYIRHQVAAGLWTRSSKGVYVAVSAPATPHQAIRVALAGAGPSALASHLSAAWLWHLLVQPPPAVHL